MITFLERCCVAPDVRRVVVVDPAHAVRGIISQTTVIAVLHQHVHRLGHVVNKTIEQLGLLGGPVTCVSANISTLEAFRTMTEKYDKLVPACAY